MDEIFRICDRLTVLRDGCVIQSMLAKDTNTENLIKLMVGRDINQQFPKIVAAKKKNFSELKILLQRMDPLKIFPFQYVAVRF